MQWIKASERLPGADGIYNCKLKGLAYISSYVQGCWYFQVEGEEFFFSTPDQYVNIEWLGLDEEASESREPSFTLPEAIEIYHNAWAHGVELSHPHDKEFFRTRFNITLP